MSRLVQHRVVISVIVAVITGTYGAKAWSFPPANPLLGFLREVRPVAYRELALGYEVLWFTTPFFLSLSLCSFAYIFLVGRRHPHRYQSLPPYPAPSDRRELFLVLGEQHGRTVPERAVQPCWLTIPERGLYTGIAIVGAIGSGKTSACMYPYVEQLLGFVASDRGRRVAALILEVKGDFCVHVREMLQRHGRGDDYVEIGLDSKYRYNPLHNDLDAYALAYGIATLMTNLFGRGKEPFWQQASTNLVKFVILLHQVLDDYVTLFQVYEHVINPDKLKAAIAEGDRRFAAKYMQIVVDKAVHLSTQVLASWKWQEDHRGSWSYWSADLEQAIIDGRWPYQIWEQPPDPAEATRLAQFEAVKRWFNDDWMRIEPKLRTSIVEGVSVFLSLFDDNPKVKHTFCPPKSVYAAAAGAANDEHAALPPIADLIDQGKVIALNFPAAMNPGLARALGTMLKQDFQRAVLNRIHRMNADPTVSRRPVVFICDEYQAFATSGENEPSGDEKFFSLARQARCIPIVATQSLSSLRSALPGEAWRTLLQGFRTKVFLALSDDFSAHIAAELCGKVERLKPSYSITEAGQDAKVSILTGRPAAHQSTVTAAKTYALQFEYAFQPRVFTELQNAQAVVIPYDGLNPLPPTFCYLKPHYLPVQESYFDQIARGAL